MKTSPLPPRSAAVGSEADGAPARVSTAGDGVAMMAWAWRGGEGKQRWRRRREVAAVAAVLGGSDGWRGRAVVWHSAGAAV